MAAYIDLLARRYPGRQFTMYANDPRTLVAVDGGPVPTKEELDALMPGVDAEIEAEQRHRGRRSVGSRQDAGTIEGDKINIVLAIEDAASSHEPVSLTLSRVVE